MAELKARVSEKFQVQIPKDIRKKLRIERGDRLVFRAKGKILIIEVEKLLKNPVANIDGILENTDIGELRTRAAQRLMRHKLGLG